MKFDIDCGYNCGGMVLIDKSFLKELDDTLLYAMELLLDIKGRSELICDFAGEEWNMVRRRETEPVQEFCNSGKMIIYLLDNAKRRCDAKPACEIEPAAEIPELCGYLHLPTGGLLCADACELMQCLYYPELEMEKETFFELELEKGWYAISNEYIDKIMYKKCSPQSPPFDNIQEIR